jgi:hypothetical protein
MMTIAEEHNTFFEIPRRLCSERGIFQVGQVLREATNPNSALLRSGPYRGAIPRQITEKIREIQDGQELVVEGSGVGPIVLSAQHSTAIDAARIDGKGKAARFQWLEIESIVTNDNLLKAIAGEEEVKRYLARENASKVLFLVTKVVKVHEIIPQSLPVAWSDEGEDTTCL